MLFNLVLYLAFLTFWDSSVTDEFFLQTKLASGVYTKFSPGIYDEFINQTHYVWTCPKSKTCNLVVVVCCCISNLCVFWGFFVHCFVHKSGRNFSRFKLCYIYNFGVLIVVGRRYSDLYLLIFVFLVALGELCYQQSHHTFIFLQFMHKHFIIHIFFYCFIKIKRCSAPFFSKS